MFLKCKCVSEFPWLQVLGLPSRRLWCPGSGVRSGDLHSLQGPQVVCMEEVLGPHIKSIKPEEILHKPVSDPLTPAYCAQGYRPASGTWKVRSRNDGGLAPKGPSSTDLRTSQHAVPHLGSNCPRTLACEPGPFCSMGWGESRGWRGSSWKETWCPWAVTGHMCSRCSHRASCQG